MIKQKKYKFVNSFKSQIFNNLIKVMKMNRVELGGTGA